jgi:hypothetical protein
MKWDLVKRVVEAILGAGKEKSPKKETSKASTNNKPNVSVRPHYDLVLDPETGSYRNVESQTRKDTLIRYGDSLLILPDGRRWDIKNEKFLK